MTLPEFVTKISETVYELRIWVQPGANRSCQAGIHDQCLKLKVKSPPVDNKANKEIVSSLAKMLNLRPRDVRLKKGHKSRRKVIHITIEKEPDWNIFET